jgi:hypothetical protein
MNPPVREQIEKTVQGVSERFGRSIEDHSRPVGNPKQQISRSKSLTMMAVDRCILMRKIAK